MFVRHMHRNIDDMEWEVLKWVAMVVIAAIAALLFATATASADETVRTGPATLPAGIHDWARPMDPDWMLPTEDMGMNVWNVLDLHRAGRASEALAAWERIELPAATRVWKHVAMADAYLAMHRLEEAAAVLDAADALVTNHPLVHYYTGLLRLEEAATADEWQDAEVGKIRLVSLPRVTPNTKSMFKLAAIMELQSAIAFASTVELDRPLLTNEWPTRAAIEPTPGDLLFALKADRFTGRAHHMLGDLYLEKGSLEAAESHFDAATTEGITVLTGYRDLGYAFDEEGMHVDAARSYLKAARAGGPTSGALRKACESFGKAFTELF